MIKFKNVSFVNKEGNIILNNVSLILSVVGLVSIPGIVFKLSLLALPAITLISDSVSNPGLLLQALK